jgi:hypothetical protein
MPDRPSFSIDEFLPSLPPGFFAARASSDAGWVEICRVFHRHLVQDRPDEMAVEVMLPWPEARDDLFEWIGRDETHYVQLFCSLEELERREVERGDRRRGLARSHYDRVYAFRDYDQRIDSTTKSPAECARLIVEAVVSLGETKTVSG